VEKRRLGRTGHLSTVAVMGCAALWDIDQAGADAALDLALERGVNHLDVAPQYGLAQERLGPWLESRRDRFFLGCKTLERTRTGAWADLRRSLELLRTDRFDLYQLHAVCTLEDLNQALAPGGAIETLVEAREQGLTRFLGITGHGMQAPATHAAALERFDFDTVMTPIYPTLYAHDGYRRDIEHLLRLTQDRDVGVMVIKSAGRRRWPEGVKRYNTWYEPYDTQPEIDRGIRFALSQPGVTAIATAGDVRLLPMVLDAAERFLPMTQQEQAEAIAQTAAEALFFAA
jgi:aryl-alcohol dehydrogenase-like predicted oxidoreductase